MADITPSVIAADLANAYIAGAQKLLTNQSQKAQTTSTALTRLRSALSSFNTALSGLSSRTTGIVQRAATLSGGDGAITSASSSARAQPGTHTLFVERLATVQQVAFEDLPAVPVALGGPIVVRLSDNSSFTVDMTLADSDGDGSLSHAEIARAINLAEENRGRVVASTVSSNGQNHLMLGAGSSGEAGQFTLDLSGLPAGALRDALEGGRELTAAQDAVVWLGGQNTGIRLQQSSNTFTAIDGVTLTLAKATPAGAEPTTLTIANDDAATADRLQSLVSAYNTLEQALKDLTSTGREGTNAAALASDPSVRSLRSRLANALRMEVDGVTLRDFGISIGRDGKLSLDRDKLGAALREQPEKLEALVGSSSLTSSSGVLGALRTATDSWTNTASGHLARRQEHLDIQQKRIAQRQEQLEMQYENAYQRYLAQFTRLQALQTQMGQTSGLFSTSGTT